MSITTANVIEAAPRLFPVVAVLAVLAALAGAPLGGPGMVAGACLAMLVLGLPHGSLDLELIRSRRRGGIGDLFAVLALYLGCASAMLALWRLEPVSALALFILIATWHFAEDWEGADLPLLEWGGALALLSAPTLFNRADLDAAFVALTGSSAAGVMTDALTLVAPVALMLAAIGLVVHWQAGRRGQAIGLGAAVAAMTVLPPIVGFALYFCLLHSPHHFGGALQTLSWTRVGQWVAVVAPLTLAALGLAALLFRLELRPSFSDQIVAASFMTLAVVTVPHMLAPRLVGMIDGIRRSRRAGRARGARYNTSAVNASSVVVRVNTTPVGS